MHDPTGGNHSFRPSDRQIQDLATSATIKTPTSVSTLRYSTSGPRVKPTATRSTDTGPTEAETAVVRNVRAALSGRNISLNFVKSPPRSQPRTSTQIMREKLRLRVSISITRGHLRCSGFWGSGASPKPYADALALCPE